MHYLPCYPKPSSDDDSSRRGSKKRGVSFFRRLFGAPKFRSTGRLVIGRPDNFKHNFHVSADDVFPASAVQSPPCPVSPKAQSAQGPVSKGSRKCKNRSTSRATPTNRRCFWTLFKKVDKAYDSPGSSEGLKHQFSALSIRSPFDFRHRAHLGVGEQFATLPASSLDALFGSGSDWRETQVVPRSSTDTGVAVAAQVPQSEAPAVSSLNIKPLPPILDVNVSGRPSSSNQLYRVSASVRKPVPYHLLNGLDRFKEPSAMLMSQMAAT